VESLPTNWKNKGYLMNVFFFCVGQELIVAGYIRHYECKKLVSSLHNSVKYL
jgi:hypothetical protein